MVEHIHYNSEMPLMIQNPQNRPGRLSASFRVCGRRASGKKWKYDINLFTTLAFYFSWSEAFLTSIFHSGGSKYAGARRGATLHPSVRPHPNISNSGRASGGNLEPPPAARPSGSDWKWSWLQCRGGEDGPHQH